MQKHIKLFEDWRFDTFNQLSESAKPNIHWYLGESTTATPREKADKIHDAINGCTTDEAAIEEVLNSISNENEWLAIIDAYGTREVTCWATFASNIDGDIFAGIDGDIDDQDLIKKFNDILRSKGVRGDFLLKNEDNFWSWETLDVTLHLLGDIASAVADSYVPGSGSVIDAFHAITYFIQAEVTRPTNRDKSLQYMIAGLIQLASIYMVGPIQAAAVALKAEAKSIIQYFAFRTMTAGQYSRFLLLSQSMKSGLNTILKGITDILAWLGTKIAMFTGDMLAWISTKLGGANFTTWLSTYFTRTLPGEVNYFLTRLAEFNPARIGSGGGGSEEAWEFAGKTGAKIYLSNKAGEELKKTMGETQGVLQKAQTELQKNKK